MERIIVRAVFVSLALAAASAFALSIWDTAAPPYQAVEAVRQVEDSTSGYVAARAAGTWHPGTFIVAGTVLAIAVVWLNAGRRAWKLAQMESSE